MDPDVFGGGDWRERLAHIVRLLREASMESDPHRLVRTYTERLNEMRRVDRIVSVSRRGLEPPWYRIARNSSWKHDVDPWRQRHELPVLQGGLIGELLDASEPRILDELEVCADDPGAEYFADMRSMVAIPVYDRGVALNLVLHMRREPRAFDPERFPQMVWVGNLFARSTHNLVLSKELEAAHRNLDEQIAQVAHIQKSLLPREIPRVPHLELAVHYRASEKAGGDYYDFFPQPDGSLGILIGDVSGHGTPAAVLMAITHAIAHLHRGASDHPSRMLEHINEQLASRYTPELPSRFVTAAYGIFDPPSRTFRFSLAGHLPPLIRRHASGSLIELDGPDRPPLGVMAGLDYSDQSVRFSPGDLLVFYTDGMSEARDAAGAFFGTAPLHEILADGSLDAQAALHRILACLAGFMGNRSLEDDLTLLVARVT